MSVDEPYEFFPRERVLEQGEGLRHVGEVARIDYGCFAAFVQDDVVGRQPAALEDLDARGQLHRGARLWGSFASTARFSTLAIADQAAISSSVRRQPSHSPVAGFILHTFVQGEGTSSGRASVMRSASRRAPARRARPARGPEPFR